MAIKNRIHSMTDHLQEAYDVVAAKGGTLPANPNMQNLATTVSQLSYSSEAQDLRAEIIGLLQDTETTLDLRKYPEVTQLRSYIGYENRNLTTVYLGNVVEIPRSAFSGCLNLANVIFSTATTVINEYGFYNCQKFEDVELPHTLTNIGRYAFNTAGAYYERGTHTFTLIDNVGVHTSIGDSAFQNSHISEIDAYTNGIAQDAFSSCNSLTDVNVEIHGILGQRAFFNCNYVENFEISPNSVITSLGDSAFYTLAFRTLAASRNISPFDFRNSTFTSVGSNVWYNNKYDGVVYFPSTLATISGNFLDAATGNWKLYFNSVPTVSSSSYLRNDSGTTFTVKYFFPYELMDQASSATNWLTHTSQIIGYGSGFEVGTTLPEYTRSSGLVITWYSDETLTTQITTSSSVTDTYYCTVGSTRAVWFVEQPGLNAASVTISDGTDTYVAGDPIPVGTSITVTPSPTDQDKQTLYLLRVNGTDYTASGTATITMNQDLSVKCMYYDGINVPFLPTLADNDWDMIKLASKFGAIPSSWAVGDTKTLDYNGTTFTARLVDKTGKFTRIADNSTAYLSFELTESLAQNEVMNPNNSNIVANSTLLANMNSGTIWNNLDSNLTSVVEEVNVTVMSQGNGGQLINLPAKIFLGREHDIISTRNYSAPAEWNVLTQDEYYQTHNTAADRKKIKKGTANNDRYWLMSPWSNEGFAFMLGDGSTTSGTTAASGMPVALRFAL